MVASATGIVSVDTMKKELRFPENADYHDDLVERHIKAAVSFAVSQTKLPLVDVTETISVARPKSAETALVIRKSHIKRIIEFKYWSLTEHLWDEPVGVIEPDDLGRLEQVCTMAALYPPSGEWPEVLSGSKFRIKLCRGLLAADIPEEVKQAIILIAREFYDGRTHEEVKNNTSYMAMLNRHKLYYREDQ